MSSLRLQYLGPRSTAGPAASLLGRNGIGGGKRGGSSTHLLAIVGVQFLAIGYLLLTRPPAPLAPAPGGTTTTTTHTGVLQDVHGGGGAPCPAAHSLGVEVEEAIFYYDRKKVVPYELEDKPFAADTAPDGVTVLPAPEATTLEEAVRLCLEHTAPVVIRAEHAQEYFGHMTVDSLLSALRSSQDLLKAYFRSSANEAGRVLPASAVVDRWVAGRSVYMVDCPSDLLPLPEWLAAHNGYKVGWTGRVGEGAAKWGEGAGAARGEGGGARQGWVASFGGGRHGIQPQES